MTRNARSQTIPKFTPRQYLNSQETVLFDTRPHFIAFVGLGRVIWFFIGSVLVPVIAAGFAKGLRAAPFWYVLLSWFLLVLLPLLIPVLKWRNRFYSLTDQRIMHGYGFISRSFNAKQLKRIGGLLDTSTYRITGVTFGQGLLGRVVNFGDINFGTNHENIYWRGIKDPLNVRRLIEEKVATFQDLGANQVTYNEAVIKKVAEIKTEESFGLVAPKHNVAIQGNLGGVGFATGSFCILLLLQLRTAERCGSCLLPSMWQAASLNLDNHQSDPMIPS
ncbi:MAG TPA: PH domain-containing protein [Terracidiphilus sp.]|nr:PH domain-containing protein [Terracidiphilus sp.]